MVSHGIRYLLTPKFIYDWLCIYNMSKEDNSSTSRKTTNTNPFETISRSVTRVVDEVAKAQPQYSQSVSNLQLDYIQTIKNTVQNTIAAQRQISDATGVSFNVPFTGQYAEQLSRQTNEITDNIVKAVQTNNQVSLNALDAARDNIRIYTKTTDAILEFNSNVAKAWTSFFSVPQQQFFRP
jgi:hypothetical protein